MKPFIWLPFFLLANCTAEEQKQPQESFYDTALFHDVQKSHLFQDSKTFVDCIPKKPLDSIVKIYLEEKNAPQFDLKEFVLQNFRKPSRTDTTFTVMPSKDMLTHIDSLWDKLTRMPEEQETGGSLIPLPYQYVVPGGRFSEIYYWDSYFTMLGLMESSNEHLVKSMLDNFAFMIDSIGFIPNGNRSYYLTRSQPPYFALMVELYANGEEQVLLDYLPQMEKEYAFWMQGAEVEATMNRLVNVEGYLVNRYWDNAATPRPESYIEDVELAHQLPTEEAKKQLYRNIRAACESGWDFSSRWMSDPNDLATIHTTDIVPVDLNCLLYKMEMLLAQAYLSKGEEEHAVIMKEAAAKRRAFIMSYCWDETSGFFYDYNIKTQNSTGKKTLAGVFPLFVAIATEEQAAAVRHQIKTEFLTAGGVLTTLEHSKQQWDAPNGWAPLHWITVKGLINYNYTSIAGLIANKWLAVNKDVYQHTGKMMEKYNVVDTTLTAGGGEYPSQDGFGWTNGVAVKLNAVIKEKQLVRNCVFK